MTNYYRKLVVVLCLAFILAGAWLVKRHDEGTLETTVLLVTLLVSAMFSLVDTCFTIAEKHYYDLLELRKEIDGDNGLVRVDRALFNYWDRYWRVRKKNGKIDRATAMQIPLDLDLSKGSEDWILAIRYLNVLERLAKLTERDYITLSNARKMFASKLFRAVNNPIIQKKVIVPNFDCYIGLARLSQVWISLLNKKGLHFPLEEFPFTLKTIAMDGTSQDDDLPRYKLKRWFEI